MFTIRVILTSFEEIPVDLPEFPHVTGALESIFRLLNHVDPGDAQRMPTGGKHRSLSAGDIVYVDGIPWGCGMMGWTRLTPSDVAQYLALPMRERRRAYRGWQDEPEH